MKIRSNLVQRLVFASLKVNRKIPFTSIVQDQYLFLQVLDRASSPYSWNLGAYCVFLLIRGTKHEICHCFQAYQRCKSESPRMFLKPLAFLAGLEQRSWEVCPSPASPSGLPTSLLGEIPQESLLVISSPRKAAAKPLCACTSAGRGSLGKAPWKEAGASTFTGACIHQETRRGKERQSAFPRC